MNLSRFLNTSVLNEDSIQQMNLNKGLLLCCTYFNVMTNILRQTLLSSFCRLLCIDSSDPGFIVERND